MTWAAMRFHLAIPLELVPQVMLHLPLHLFFSASEGNSYCPVLTDLFLLLPFFRFAPVALITLLQLHKFTVALFLTVSAFLIYPGTVVPMLEAAMSVVPVEKLAVHFHDTYGQSLSNILISLQVTSYQRT